MANADDLGRPPCAPATDSPNPPERSRPGAATAAGQGELLFDENGLDTWLAAQPDLQPPERINPATLRTVSDERVTLGRFAAVIGKDRKTVTQHRARPASQPGRGQEVLPGRPGAHWNTRARRRGPARHPSPVTPGSYDSQP